MASLEHPGIVRIYSIDEQGDRIRLSFERIQGEDVVEKGGPLSATEAARIGLDLCRALSAIHGSGLVHLDIKAANVMREKGGRIVLFGFSVARSTAGGEDEDLPLGGTPLSTAPEQLRSRTPRPRGRDSLRVLPWGRCPHRVLGARDAARFFPGPARMSASAPLRCGRGLVSPDPCGEAAQPHSAPERPRFALRSSLGPRAARPQTHSAEKHARFCSVVGRCAEARLRVRALSTARPRQSHRSAPAFFRWAGIGGRRPLRLRRRGSIGTTAVVRPEEVDEIVCSRALFGPSASASTLRLVIRGLSDATSRPI